MRAVQRTFPEVYESTTKIEMCENETTGVKVNSSDFEHALMNLTPSNRRHVSQFDLVSLQKPQSLLYDLQGGELRSVVISPNLKKNLIKDPSGKVTWQLLDPLVIKICYNSRIHPESFVWRFVCGIADGLDGFGVLPMDLLVLRNDSSGFEISLWRGLNEARLKGGAFCVLFKSFNGLTREERKIFISVIKRFINSLVPGEPVILIYTGNSNKKTLVKNTSGIVNKFTGFVKKFSLVAPCRDQYDQYFNFILKSFYRILSSEKTLKFNESDFVTSFQREEFMDKTVLQLEQLRMEMGALIRDNLKTFNSKYFNGHLNFEETEKEIVTKTEDGDICEDDPTEEDPIAKTEDDPIAKTEDVPTEEDPIDDLFNSSDHLSEVPEDLLFK